MKQQRLSIKGNIPDLVDVPPNTLLAITHNDACKHYPKELILNLNGQKKRDWFSKQAYFCLPLLIANQYGFVLLAAYNFSVFWNGREEQEGVTITHNEKNPRHQNITSNFGMGTFTVETPWLIRTPKGVNTLITNPPNYFIDGISFMSAVVETDNLRRNFAFTLKITRPNHLIQISKGTPIGYMLPYPRYFADSYSLKVDEEVISKEVLQSERITAFLFGKERKEVDAYHNPHSMGHRYTDGIDIYGNEFKDHQKTMGCPMGFIKKIFSPKEDK